MVYLSQCTDLYIRVLTYTRVLACTCMYQCTHLYKCNIQIDIMDLTEEDGVPVCLYIYVPVY